MSSLALATNIPLQMKHYFPQFDKFISEEIYWRDYYDLPDTIYEWNNGYLEEKPMSDQATGLIYAWFLNLLQLFLDTQPIATFTLLDMGFRFMHLRSPRARRPDLGVVLNNNPVPLMKNDRRYEGIFDLCVEALSDSNKFQKERDTIIKKAEYASGGVKEYFILHDSEELAFYRMNMKGVYAHIPQSKNGVICSSVLPGFQFRVSDLLSRPNAQKMLQDPVYQGFVLPAWQIDKKHAQIEATLRLEAEQRAQIEATLRLEAEQRAQIEATLRLEAEQRTQIEATLRLEAEQRAQLAAALHLAAQAEIARLKMLFETHS